MRINPEWVDSAYLQQVDGWLWREWGYSKRWRKHLPRMILWYSTAGSATMSADAGYTYLERIERGERLPAYRRLTWAGAQRLSRKVCGTLDTNPVDWPASNANAPYTAWLELQSLHGIGPKIASFILRDLSLLRDYSSGLGGINVVYRKRADRRWFRDLAPKNQALFIPIDKYVHAAARKHGVSYLFRRYSARTIQADPGLHRSAAAAIARWAKKRNLDPRDLDIYWYATGQGYLDSRGRPSGIA